jgi:hypothetical protein
MPVYRFGGTVIRSETELSPEELEEVFAEVSAEERTPPADETPSFGTFVGDQFLSALRSMVDPQAYVTGFQDSTKVLPILGSLVGPVGAGVGEAARQSLAGEEPSAGGVMKATGGTILGGMLGRGLSKAANVASRLRPVGAGADKDVGRWLAPALEKMDPLLRPAQPTVAGLQRHVVGGGAAEAVGQARRRGLDEIAGELTTRMRAGYAPPGGGVGSAQELRTLLKELADANEAAFSRITGDLRGGAVLQPLRERQEILGDLQRLLPADLFTKLQGLQKQYGLLREAERLFEPQTRVGAPLGGGPPTAGLSSSGLNMPEVQRRVAAGEADLRKLLGPDADAVLARFFRGGPPPVGDRQFALSLSRYGGMGPRLGFEYLAGPGWQTPLGPLGAMFGVGLSRALSNEDDSTRRPARGR